MPDRALIIPASEESPLEAFDTFAAAFGRPPRKPRNRAAEAEYLAAINAHWKATQAKMERVTGSHFERACQKMSLIRAHELWAAEQARLWVNGMWVGERKDLAA